MYILVVPPHEEKKEEKKGRKLEKKNEKIFGVEIAGICGASVALVSVIGQMFNRVRGKTTQ